MYAGDVIPPVVVVWERILAIAQAVIATTIIKHCFCRATVLANCNVWRNRESTLLAEIILV